MSGKPYRILITGSRDWPADDLLLPEHLGRAMGDGAREGRRAVIVHGACPTGADALADRIARDHGVDVEAWLPDWERHGRAAGPIRNREMVKAGADVCLAFVKDCSPGATGCADMAERAGIAVRRFERKTEPERPSPAELWGRSGGNRGLYRDLLAEHGHLLGPGGEGCDPAAPRLPPCGRGPSS